MMIRGPAVVSMSTSCSRTPSREWTGSNTYEWKATDAIEIAEEGTLRTVFGVDPPEVNSSATGY